MCWFSCVVLKKKKKKAAKRTAVCHYRDATRHYGPHNNLLAMVLNAIFKHLSDLRRPKDVISYLLEDSSGSLN